MAVFREYTVCAELEWNETSQYLVAFQPREHCGCCSEVVKCLVCVKHVLRGLEADFACYKRMIWL